MNAKYAPIKNIIKHYSLQYLKRLEKEKPKKRIYFDILHSGIVLDSEVVKRRVIKVIEELIDSY